ncbi:TPA: hypothetical protein ACUNF5_005247 [Burkholderia orbicola]
MNVAIEYPEEFPLDEVDRRVFSQQIRKLLHAKDVYGCELDSLRERAGLESSSPFDERAEIATLIKLSQRDSSPAVVDRLFERLGDYLNVRISHANYSQEPDGSAQFKQGGRAIRTVLTIGCAAVVGLCGGVAIRHFYPLPAAVATSAASSTAPVLAPNIGPAFDIERPTLSANNDSVPTVDMTFESARPGSDLAALRRVLPADGGVYLVSLQVTPLIAAPLAPASSVRTSEQANKVAK